MNAVKKYLLPVVTGFVSAEAAAGLSVLVFTWGGMLLYDGSKGFPQGFSVSLSLMMTLSAFLLYAAMILCGRITANSGGEGKYSGALSSGLFLLGAVLAAAGSIVTAMTTDFGGAALVLICYMIVCDLILIAAFALITLIFRYAFKILGKDPEFLSQPKFCLPAFLCFAAIVFFCLLFF